MTRYRVHPIAVDNPLQNYIWMLIDEHSRHCVAIDPTQADLVLEYCQQYDLKLTQIWITHKHADHIGGLLPLKQQTQARVYASLAEQATIKHADYWLEEGDCINAFDLTFQVIATPGHTLGHICYYCAQIACLFSGDTLFAMGCGRLFEGTYVQMYNSLQKLASLPDDTQVYCTHEYTQANAEFARAAYPDHDAIAVRYQQVVTQRQHGQITLPSYIQLEKQTNPFLLASNVDEFKRLRLMKDRF